MWFLLSLNLSHWIGSFSTVGLDSHLGFRQKGLREAFYFTFSFLEKRRLKERAEFFPGCTILRGGTDLARIPQHPYSTVWKAQKSRKVLGTFTEKVDCIYYSPYPAQISRPYSTDFEAVQHRNRGLYSLYGQYLFCTDVEVVSGTVFEEYSSI